MQTSTTNPYTANDLRLLIGTTDNPTDQEEDNGFMPDIFLRLFLKRAGFFMITDFFHMKYLFVSPSVKPITGYSLRTFQEEGPEFTFTLFHPDESALIKSIHQKIVSFFQTLSAQDKLNYSFTYDLKIKKQDGEYIRLLCRLECIQTDIAGNIYIASETYTDITSFDSFPYLTLKIVSNAKAPEGQDLLYHFYPLKKNIHLTQRELEIENLVQEGYKSKEIAEKLHLSKNTVDTHRRKIRQKSGL